MDRVLSFCVLAFLTVTVTTTSQRLVCYFPSWGVYRPGPYSFSPRTLEPRLCSHVVWAFVEVEGNAVRPVQGEEKDQLKELTSLKSSNPSLRVMFSIGGASASDYFSDVIKSPATLDVFATSVVAFTLENDLDGVDIDWEFPTAQQSANFTELLKIIRERLDNASSGHLLLSVALGANKELIESTYQVPNIARLVDFASVISYDLRGPWDGVTGLHSALYPQSPHWPFASQDWVMSAYIEHGFDPEKLLLGVPFYGRSYALCPGAGPVLDSPACGPGTGGPYSNEAGVMLYFEICEAQARGGWNMAFDSTAKSAFTSKDNQWISYENQRTVKEKVTYARSRQLGGIMIWDASQDDYLGKCGAGPFPLLTTISKGLGIVPEGYGQGNSVDSSPGGGVAGTRVHYAVWVFTAVAAVWLQG